MVYAGPRSRTFHKDLDCMRLVKAKAVEVQITDRALHPCRFCYPDQPKAPKILKQYCRKCMSKNPCAHNGGVLRSQTVTIKKHSLLSAPGDTFQRRQYVWPDSATLVFDQIK